MKLSIAALTYLPIAALAVGSGSSYSYDPASDYAPLAWASLDIEGNECGGSKQSGIDVPTSSCDVFGDYVFSAGSCTFDNLIFTVNDHSVKAEYDTSSGCVPPRMTIPGQPTPYEALQFHIHSGTDHAVDGRYFGADFHLVHKQVGGSGFSVLGFFIEPTDPDGIAVFRDLLSEWETVAQGTLSTCTALAALGVVNNTSAAQQGGGRQLNKDEQSHRQLPRSFNPYDLIPEGATMYTYEGSLTTPPCSEVVFWNVIDTPVSVSIREFLRLTNLILNYIKPDTCKFASIASPSGFTGRPVQAINGRTIERICPSGFIDPLASRAASGETGSMSDDSGALSTAGAMAAIASALSAVLAFL